MDHFNKLTGNSENTATNKPSYLQKIAQERAANLGEKRGRDSEFPSPQPTKNPRIDDSSRDPEIQSTNLEAERPLYQHLERQFSKTVNDRRAQKIYCDLLHNEHQELYYNSLCYDFIFRRASDLGLSDAANDWAQIYLNYSQATTKWSEFTQKYQTEVNKAPLPNGLLSVDQQWNDLKNENNNLLNLSTHHSHSKEVLFSIVGEKRSQEDLRKSQGEGSPSERPKAEKSGKIGEKPLRGFTGNRSNRTCRRARRKSHARRDEPSYRSD